MPAARRAQPYRRALSRAAIVCAAATAGVVLSALPALAHITITPGSAKAGSAAVLTFHVPDEQASAYVTRVDMQVPTDHPIAQLLVEPVAGWTISVRTVTLAKPLITDDGQFTQAVSEVIWSGGRIAPGQFQDFSLSADPLPANVTELAFKTIQTYSNGDVVRWIDVPVPGQAEPDHPAPVLVLTAAAAGTEGTGGTGGAAGTAASPASAAVAGSDATARALGAGGAAIGLLGLALAGLSWRRSRGQARTPAVTVLPEPEPQPASSARAAPAQGAPGQGAPAQGAPRRKGASGRRRASRR